MPFDRLMSVVSEAFGEMARSEDEPTSVVAFAHDLRKHHGDVEIAETLRSGLDSALLQRVLVTNPALSAGENKGIAGQLDLVISGRMYLAIAALRMGVPTCCLAYGGKFEGLFRQFGLGHLSLTAQEAMQPRVFANFAISALRDREKIRGCIRKRLAEVETRALRNLDECG